MKALVWVRKAIFAAALAAAPVAGFAADSPAAIEWKATDCAGKAVSVPVEGRPSIVVFVMAGQSRSADALAVVKQNVQGANAPQVVVVVSGDDAKLHAAKLAGTEQCPWPVVADPDYAATGKMGVRVWPTTLIVAADGRQIAHLAGTPKSFGWELESYLAFAAGKIDQATLDKRLAGNETVVDSPEQIASRHLQVAQRLMDKGLTDQARNELNAGLKLHPESAPIRLALARLMLAANENAQALDVLGKITPGSIPGGQLDLLRGTALGRLGKLDEAKEALQASIKLHPYPAEGWYQLGQVLEKQEQWKAAADAYRRAFEATDQGRKSATREGLK